MGAAGATAERFSNVSVDGEDDGESQCDMDDGEDFDHLSRMILNRRIFQLSRKFYQDRLSAASITAKVRLKAAYMSIHSGSRTILRLNRFLKSWCEEHAAKREERQAIEKQQLEEDWTKMNAWLEEVVDIYVSEDFEESMESMLRAIEKDHADLYSVSLELAQSYKVLDRELSSLLKHSLGTIEEGENLKREISETTDAVRSLLEKFLQDVERVKEVAAASAESERESMGRRAGVCMDTDNDELADSLAKVLDGASERIARAIACEFKPVSSDSMKGRRTLIEEPLELRHSVGPASELEPGLKSPLHADAEVYNVFENADGSSAGSELEEVVEGAASMNSSDGSERSLPERVHDFCPSPQAEHLPRKPRKICHGMFYCEGKTEDISLREAVCHMSWRSSPVPPSSDTMNGIPNFLPAVPPNWPPIAARLPEMPVKRGKYLRPCRSQKVEMRMPYALPVMNMRRQTRTILDERSLKAASCYTAEPKPKKKQSQYQSLHSVRPRFQATQVFTFALPS